MTHEEITELRKTLVATKKKVALYIVKQRELEDQIFAAEKACAHKYGARTYVKIRDHFLRECERCGRQYTAKE